jgi:hypothetical protein
MENSFETSISKYQALFKLEAGQLHITLKSFPKMTVLFARYSADNIPNKLHNMVESPAELYELL